MEARVTSYAGFWGRGPESDCQLWCCEPGQPLWVLADWLACSTPSHPAQTWNALWGTHCWGSSLLMIRAACQEASQSWASGAEPQSCPGTDTEWWEGAWAWEPGAGTALLCRLRAVLLQADYFVLLSLSSLVCRMETELLPSQCCRGNEVS